MTEESVCLFVCVCFLCIFCLFVCLFVLFVVVFVFFNISPVNSHSYNVDSKYRFHKS